MISWVEFRHYTSRKATHEEEEEDEEEADSEVTVEKKQHQIDDLLQAYKDARLRPDTVDSLAAEQQLNQHDVDVEVTLTGSQSAPLLMASPSSMSIRHQRFSSSPLRNAAISVVSPPTRKHQPKHTAGKANSNSIAVTAQTWRRSAHQGGQKKYLEWYKANYNCQAFPPIC